MRNSVRVLLVSALAIVFLGAPAVAQEDTIEWLDNYEKALAEAKRTHKPIFLEFRCEA